jgi:hypothetical protein
MFNRISKYVNLASLLSPLIAGIFIATWYLYSYDKRLCIVENTTSSISMMDQRLDNDDKRLALLELQYKDMSYQVNSVNDEQNKEMQELHQDLNDSMARLEDKIERIYVFISARKNETKII